MNTETSHELVSDDFVKAFIMVTAERFATLRQLQRLKYLVNHPDDIPDTQNDITGDWEEACTYFAMKIIDGDMPDFARFSEKSYTRLANIWIHDVKKQKAFYIWEQSKAGAQEENYYKACEAIRESLTNKDNPPLSDFNNVEKFLEEHYLTNGRLDESKAGTNILIGRKAQRIYETTNNLDEKVNWFRAKLYTSMYYNNIIPAIKKDNNKNYNHIANILKAFEFSKSTQHRYLIINSFEVALAVYFINKDTVKSIIDDDNVHDFNMVPVSNWPVNYVVPQTLKRKFRFDIDDSQIIYEGRMTESDKGILIEALTQKDHRNSIEELYALSNLGPAYKMVL